MASIWDVGGSQPAQPQAPTWPGAGGSGNPFYNGGNYGQSQDWYSSPISENIREENQNLAFASWANRMGVGNNDNTFNRWMYTTQRPRFQEAYGLATMDNPMMTIDQFISTLPQYQQMRAEYDQLSPEARGARYNAYAPNVRWIPR